MLRNARRCGDATNGNVVKLGALAGRASAKAQSYAPAAWPRMVGQPASSSPWHPVANTGDRPSGILSTTVKFRLSLVQGGRRRYLLGPGEGLEVEFGPPPRVIFNT